MGDFARITQAILMLKHAFAAAGLAPPVGLLVESQEALQAFERAALADHTPFAVQAPKGKPTCTTVAGMEIRPSR